MILFILLKKFNIVCGGCQMCWGKQYGVLAWCSHIFLCICACVFVHACVCMCVRVRVCVCLLYYGRHTGRNTQCSAYHVGCRIIHESSYLFHYFKTKHTSHVGDILLNAVYISPVLHFSTSLFRHFSAAFTPFLR